MKSKKTSKNSVKKSAQKKAPVRKAAKAVKAPKSSKAPKVSKASKPPKAIKTSKGAKVSKASKAIKAVKASKPPKASKPAKKTPKANRVARPSSRSVSPAASSGAESTNALGVREALEIAIQFEHKVRDHYARGAELIQEPAGRRVFTSLAKEEQGHVDFLKDRLAEWTSTGTFEAKKLSSILPSPDWVRDAEQKHRAAATGKRVAEQDEVESLKTALRLEKEASSFYHDLVHRLPPADRGLFEQFLTIEDGHLAIVQAELDAVQGWGYWFDVQEFALEAQ